MPDIQSAAGENFDASGGVVIVGAGAAGLVAALAAKAGGGDPIVIERDAVASGSTALSAGLIPAAGTRFQRHQGIDDTVAQFRADILAKSHGRSDAAVLDAATQAIGPALEWLVDAHGLVFDVIADFRYPGHSAYRMHGLPSRSGAELINRLRAAAEAAGITIIPSARVATLYAALQSQITGIAFQRPDGKIEQLGCRSLVLACNGYGGNKAMVARHIPALADALWFGHSGNEGDAVAWGEALGAGLKHMTGHQGHGSVATPHGILITWATITEGGFQVNAAGHRFSNEAKGYSEQGAIVIAQPGHFAWTIFDARIASIARQFEDFRNAEAQGAVLMAPTMAALAAKAGLPADALEATLAEVEAAKAARASDVFGRAFAEVASLTAPYAAVKVTGALFHTQGGLAIDRETHVLRRDGSPLPNLFAAGGAAVGLSGPDASGYLSGNGLLTAVALGRIAGTEAARLADAENGAPRGCADG